MREGQPGISLSAMMQSALRLQQAGRFDEAKALYQKILKIRPDIPEATHFLGLTLHQLGRAAEGVKMVRRSVAMQPSNAVFQNNLGLTLKTTGMLPEAEKAHRAAVRLQPAFPEAWFNLGIVLQDQGKLGDAVQAYQRAVTARPNYVKAFVNLAGCYRELGRAQDAVDACQAALLAKPDTMEASLILAAALGDLNRMDDALLCVDEALRLSPNSTGLICAKAKLIAEKGNLDEAARLYQGVLEDDPKMAVAHLGLATIAQTSGSHADALKHFERTLALRPDDATAIYGLAHCRRFSGTDKDAIRRYEKTLARQTMRRLDETNLHFALGKMLDDCGRYDEAFDHYRLGNSLKRASMAFDRPGHKAYIDALIATFDEAFLAEHERSGWANNSELPVYVLGMPRSGTTLVEQILASHPSVLAGGEMPYLPDLVRAISSHLPAGAEYPADIGRLDSRAALSLTQRYLACLPPRRAGQIRVTDKMTNNFQHVGLIAILFPRARIIHCRRDRMDVALSIYFQNFAERHPYAYDLGDIGFYYREYERLMAHWKSVLGSRLFEVDYEELVSDQETVSHRLVACCGLDWDECVLGFHRHERHVKTASQWQVRQPIFRTSVQRWKHYEKHLSPLREALGE